MATDVRLTQTVKKGGCAAKIGAGTLSALLSELPTSTHPDLLVGRDHLDDAAVWRVSDDVAMVQTLDFFTPVVDSPEDFGAIAAANALSDVYAMGGTPITALTILAFPLGVLPDDVLPRLMHGALESMASAGAHLVGGHSIEDDTLKLGFSVTGLVHPARVWSNRGARPGDVLILTKALGTGTLSGARKNDEIDAAAFAPAIASMRRVNRLDLPATLQTHVHAATDITGFGLLGHGLHVALGSNVALEIDAPAVPTLPGAQATLQRGILTKAHQSNTRYVEAHTLGREALPEWAWWLLVDPQTSGGLLLSVAPEAADELIEAARVHAPEAAVVGRVLESPAATDPRVLRLRS